VVGVYIQRDQDQQLDSAGGSINFDDSTLTTTDNTGSTVTYGSATSSVPSSGTITYGTVTHGALYGKIGDFSTPMYTTYVWSAGTGTAGGTVTYASSILTTPIYGNVPVIVQDVSVRNTVDTWGVEASYMHRFRGCPWGSSLDLLVGARYYEFNDNYDVSCGGTYQSEAESGLNYTNFMAGSYWNTTAENHIVGPQIGLRWRKSRGRWTFNSEGRFTAGFNSTNFTQDNLLGASIHMGEVGNPMSIGPTASSWSKVDDAFSPMVELRFEAEYKVTSMISVRGGWSGMWVGNVARASSMVEYNFPYMGLKDSVSRENVFVNGLTLGVQINR
jgi:hypothetical protein